MVRWPSHSLTTAYSPLHSTILFIIIISCILLFLFLFFLKKKKKGAKETHSTCQTFWRSEDLSCFCLFLSSEEEEGGGPFSEGTTMSERRTKRPHCQCSCFLCVPLALGMRIENGKGIVPRHRDFGVWTPRHTQLTDKAVVKEEKETAVPLPICPILSSLTDWLTLYNRHRHLNCCSRRIPSLSVFFPCFCSFYFHPSIYRLLFCLCHRVTSLFSSPLYCVSVPPFVIAHGRCNCLLLYLFFYVHCNDVGVVSYSRRVTPPPPRLCVLFLHTHIDTVDLLVLVILLFFIYFQAILVLWPMFIVSRGGGFFGLKQPQKNCRGRALIEVRTENMTEDENRCPTALLGVRSCDHDKIRFYLMIVFPPFHPSELSKTNNKFCVRLCNTHRVESTTLTTTAGRIFSYSLLYYPDASFLLLTEILFGWKKGRKKKKVA